MAKSNGIVGKYFHSFESGVLVWQGQVVGNPETGWYLVDTFSWVDGCFCASRLVRIEEMGTWNFYPDAETMKNAKIKEKT